MSSPWRRYHFWIDGWSEWKCRCRCGSRGIAGAEADAEAEADTGAEAVAGAVDYDPEISSRMIFPSFMIAPSIRSLQGSPQLMRMQFLKPILDENKCPGAMPIL